MRSNGRENIDYLEVGRGQGFFFFSFSWGNCNHNNFVSTETIVLIFFSPVNKMDLVVDLRE